MTSIAPPPSYQRSIWKCACACSFYRQTRKCKNQFDSVACNSCQLYIKQYTSLDQAAMRLYMLEADTHAKQVRREARSQDVKNFFWILLGIGIIGGSGWIFWNSGLGPLLWRTFVAPRPVRRVELVVPDPEPTPTVVRAEPVAAAGPRVASEQQVWDTLNRTYNSVYDVTKDGTINCQDYAVLFYKYFPYRESVRIMYNPEVISRGQIYKPTGEKTRAHLFNAIYLGQKGWETVEPQSAKFPRKVNSYYMWYHVLYHEWDLYRRSLDKDVTASYKKYVD